MRGFLFILSVVSTFHRIGLKSDLFQGQEHIHAGLGLGLLDITYACTNKCMPHANGRAWIKEQFSKLRRRRARNSGVRPNDHFFSVSNFSVFFFCSWQEILK